MVRYLIKGGSMANYGEIINKSTLNNTKILTYSGANNLCYWSNTTYYYIAAWCFAMQFVGNYALVCPGYKVWLQKWNGSAWEELAYMYVKNNKKTFSVNMDNPFTGDAESKRYDGDGYIYRFVMQPWEGSYREYLAANLEIHSVGDAINYEPSIKDRQICCVETQITELTKLDRIPGEVATVTTSEGQEIENKTHVYNTTLKRGSPILATGELTRFLPKIY